jgi:predicted aspartyl protease
MALWHGYFAKSGSPALKISIAGPLSQPTEFEGILDTGFTGFISMPMIQAFPLGLVLKGTTTVVLADGSQSVNLTALGQVTIEGHSETGLILLEPSSNEILLGMGFLRLFKRTLFVSANSVLLADDSELKKAAESIQAKSVSVREPQQQQLAEVAKQEAATPTKRPAGQRPA